MVHHAALTSLFLVLTLIVPMSQAHAQQVAQDTGSMHNRITITIGEKAFAATLADNPTADAFRKLLPLSITMSELNGNEKLFRLPANLPTQESVPPSIQAGDLMLYGARTVVLFYKSFPTVYSYTRIGRIDDPAGLAAAVGAGSVAVNIEAAPARHP
jgi:hypothetical protein